MSLESNLPRLKELVKNRQGPFKICAKNSVSGYYSIAAANIDPFKPWSQDKQSAYSYNVDSKNYIFERMKFRSTTPYCSPGEIVSIALVNAGPDIPLSEKDFK
jgi:hypothetical protein